MAAKLRVGILGTGFGARVQAPGFQRSGEFEVAAVWSRTRANAERAAEKLGISRVYDDWEELVALPDLDAVSVATPPALHHAPALAALRAGKHVLCEKPFALDRTQGREMVAVAQAAGRVGMIDHEFRFASARAYVKALIDAGEIGRPYLVNIAGTSSLMAQPNRHLRGWFGDPAMGAGWLGVSGSHMIDLVRFWCGEFAEVCASLASFAAPAGAPAPDDSFSLLFRLTSGVEGVIQQTAASWGERYLRMQVVGEKGTLLLLDERGELYGVREGSRRPIERLAIPERFQAAAPLWELKAAGGSTYLEIPAFTALACAFAAAIRGEAPPSPSFEDGLRCQEVMDAARISHAEGRWVALPLPEVLGDLPPSP
jgi:predicted dehydrogenase